MRSARAVAVALWLSLIALAAGPNKPIVPNVPEAAAANRDAIQTATDRLAIPAGVIAVDVAPTLTGANNGLTMIGSGKIANVDYGGGDYMQNAALLVRAGLDGKACLSWRGDESLANRPAVMPPRQVGWLFQGSDSALTAPKPIRILPGNPVPVRPDLQFMRAWHGVPFGQGKYEYIVPAGHGLAIGDDLFATDGPLINECVGEFARITAATTNTVTLAKPLTRYYSQGTFCKGPFPARMSLSGMTLQGQLGTLILQQATDVQLSDLTVLPVSATGGGAAEWLALIGCGRVELRRCTAPGFGMSSGQGIRFVECTGGSLKGEQGQVNVTLERCRLGWLDSMIQCDNWTLTDCEFSEWFGIYDAWTVTRCRCNGLVYVRGRQCKVTDLRTTGQVIVQGDYWGAPAGAAQGVILDGIEAAYISIYPGTSGSIRNCSCPIYCNDAATRLNWTKDGRPLP